MSLTSASTSSFDDQFHRLAGFASSFSMGAVAAFIASIQQINPTLEFKIGIFTLLAFVVFFGITSWVYRIIFVCNRSYQKPDYAELEQRSF